MGEMKMKKLGYSILVDGEVVVQQSWNKEDIEHETIVEQFDSDLQDYIDEDEDDED